MDQNDAKNIAKHHTMARYAPDWLADDDKVKFHHNNALTIETISLIESAAIWRDHLFHVIM